MIAHARREVAIVGLACTYPGARNAAQFWKNIVDKLSAIEEVDPRRWEPERFYDPEPGKEDKLYFKHVGSLGTSFTFNPLKLGIPPSTIEGAEPDHFLMLRTVYEALDDADYIQRTFNRERTSLIVGRGNYVTPGVMWVTLRTTITETVMNVIGSLRPDLDTAQLARLRKLLQAKLPRLTPENAGGLIPNIVTGRVANRLDFMGRNFTIDAACASSLLAAEDGVQSLLAGTDDMVIAGGLHIAGHIPFLSVFNVTRAMSQTSTIRPFDSKADGTMASEGCGVIVMKRLEDAERDGDRIYAVIKGAGSASDGRAKGLMAPRVEGEVLALHRAYAMSGVDPGTIGMVEGHGTGTPVGDATEVDALHKVFGPGTDQRKICALGSVKSNIGHAMPAAGAAGIIKTALALYHRVLPPTINVTEPHPALQKADSRFYLNTETRPWIHRQDGTPRRACVNAFGFGGINAHLVLEEYTGADEKTQPTLLPEWEQELFVLEGRTRSDLLARLQQIRQYATAVEGIRLRDLAYTLNTSLEGLRERVSIVASSLEDLATRIDRVAQRLADPECHQIRERQGLFYFDSEELRTGKLGLMFPGEGSQYLNMLSDLCVHFPEVRECFEETDQALAGDESYTPPSEIVFPPPSLSATEEAAAEARLWSIERATEAVLTADGAVYRLLENLGVRPDFLTGHSAGEWLAMAVSGMVNREELVAGMPRLAEMYRKLADEQTIPQMAMLAVGAGKDRVAELTRKIGANAVIANDNCAHQVVVVVDPADAERVTDELLKSGVFVERLPYERGYHTPAFTYICDPLRKFFQALNFRKPAIPVICCTTAEPFTDDLEEAIETVANTFSRPLLFQQTIERMYAEGVRIFVETGPRGNLTAFVDDILRGRPHLAIPVDQFRRPGLLALQHAVGMLMAVHQPLDVSILYRRRLPRKLTLDAKADSVTPEEKQPGAIQISLCYPEFEAPSRDEFPNSAAPPAASAPETLRIAAAPSEKQSYVPAELAAVSAATAPRFVASPQSPLVPASVASSPAVPLPSAQGLLGEHLYLMEEFLSTQENVLSALLGSHSNTFAPEIPAFQPGWDDITDAEWSEAEPATPQSANAPPGPQATPLLRHYEVLEERPGEFVRMSVRLDLQEHLFLADHVLFLPRSEREDLGGARPNMPLTGSLELMCEAATRLMPGLVVTGIRNATAPKPIFTEERGEPVEVLLEMRRMDTQQVHVALRPAGGKETLSDCTVVFGAAFSPAPLAEPFQLVNARAAACDGPNIYTDRRMFHGPRFQGIHAVHAIGENGMTGQLRVLPNDTCLRSDPAPRYIIDFHLFDAAGQLAGYWPTEYFDESILLLPVRIGEVTRYSPSPPPGTILDLQVKVREITARQLRADLDLILPDGRVWLRVVGWQDWRFNWNRRQYEFLRFPNENPVGRPLAHTAFPALGIHCQLVDTIPELSKPGLSEELWTYNLFSAQDRRTYQAISGEAARVHWLYQMSAAKDAVCVWARAKGRKVFPADVRVEADGEALRVSAFWQSQIGMPYASAAVTSEIAVGVAADQPVTVAVEQIIRGSQPLEHAFVPEEREWIERLAAPDEWTARAVAAKKAVARYLRPESDDGDFWTTLLIPRIDESTGELAVADPGSAVNAEDTIQVFTARDGKWAIAIAWK